MVLALAAIVVVGGCKKKQVPPAPPAAPPPPQPKATLSVSPESIDSRRLRHPHLVHAGCRERQHRRHWKRATKRLAAGFASRFHHLPPHRDRSGRLCRCNRPPHRVNRRRRRRSQRREPPNRAKQSCLPSPSRTSTSPMIATNSAPDVQTILISDAAFLHSHPSIKFTIEGHCDERGSTDYNLALGDNRANAAREALVKAGISADQIKVISYGKEKPFCTQSNEECWQMNRRDHFVYGQIAEQRSRASNRRPASLRHALRSCRIHWLARHRKSVVLK